MPGEDRGVSGRVGDGAVPAEALPDVFPALDLPIVPPFPPMEARLEESLPGGAGWVFEPKWDGFRCLAFKSGDTVALQSKSGQALGRYFPEMVEAVRRLPVSRVVLDGEIVVDVDGHLSFDDLLQRIHPAESRVRRLGAETPAMLLAFDLLVDGDGASLIDRPLPERRRRLEALLAGADAARIHPSPATPDRALAEAWLGDLATGLDGVMAKRADVPYRSGERTGMVKVKRRRTADCVVGGFRYQQPSARGADGSEIGSLLLGLYDASGLLHHVGF